MPVFLGIGVCVVCSLEEELGHDPSYGHIGTKEKTIRILKIYHANFERIVSESHRFL